MRGSISGQLAYEEDLLLTELPCLVNSTRETIKKQNTCSDKKSFYYNDFANLLKYDLHIMQSK